MQKELEKIKTYLDSEAGIITADGEKQKRTIVDNRFELIDKYVSSVRNKDEYFYSELVKLISIYIDKIYDMKTKSVPKVVFDINGELIPQNYDTLWTANQADLKMANHHLSGKLFDYVCEILEKNQEIKLDAETLTRLLNRNPKPFTLAIAVDDYLYRVFDFKKLVKIIDKNKLLKKSGISIDEVYQILIDSYQIDNEEIFTGLVKPEEFKENNTRVMELLNQCNVGTFAKISSIIIRCYDKDFDIITLAKKKNTKNFFERLIIYMLSSHISNNDYLLIHQLLNDEEISLNYDFYYSDYFGQSTLKDLLAFSSDRNVIRDLLSKPENIKGCYFNGDWAIQLYRLYAKLGDYEKALELFESSYNYAYDFSEDYTKGFKNGQATADFQYSDSLADFIKNICDSFEKDKVDYIYQKDIINRILNCKNVIYINIDKVLPIIEKVLSEDDFIEILSSLEERHNSGYLGFTTVEENNSFYGRYTIRIATEEEIQNSLAKLKNKDKNPKLTKKLIPPRNAENK
ncbi:MAG: hypothetical protein IJZ46_01215 [Bacilli bacterium]|nr:hypothetical protein [Bacilli bacterium]